jgi:hypothetical protein
VNVVLAAADESNSTYRLENVRPWSVRNCDGVVSVLDCACPYETSDW